MKLRVCRIRQPSVDCDTLPRRAIKKALDPYAQAYAHERQYQLSYESDPDTTPQTEWQHITWKEGKSRNSNLPPEERVNNRD